MEGLVITVLKMGLMVMMAQGVLRLTVLFQLPRVPHLRLKAPKRQGETISKGRKNYELMLNLQLGIRYLS